MKISVVIPTLNESPLIENTVKSLVGLGFNDIIVSDGGSIDGTAERARHAGARVVAVARGRAFQMNAGAAEAKGDVLLFLHADTRLPPNASALIKSSLDLNAIGGAFHLRFEPAGLYMRIQAFCSNLRSYYSVPFGDQALFVRRDFFVRTGGFPDWLLMEDVALARRIKKYGRLQMIRTPVVTSARRYQKQGFWRTAVRNQILLAAFYLGVSPDRLARHYRYD